jgi:hypothetical protein
MCQYSLHIPYYVWRSPPQEAQHPRQANKDKRGLRKTRDVTFLNPGEPCYLHEAQVSCVLAGSDKRNWVAYFLVDTYFDAGGEAQEKVQDYYEEGLDEDCGMNADPFTYGVKNGDDPIFFDPTEYFLTIVCTRMAPIANEWTNLVDKVKTSILAYERVRGETSEPQSPSLDELLIDSKNHYRLLHKHTSADEQNLENENLQELRTWVANARGLSNMLSKKLSETVEVCEDFRRLHARHFRRTLRSRDVFSTLQEIVAELRSRKSTLESLASRCDSFAEDVSLGCRSRERKLVFRLLLTHS